MKHILTICLVLLKSCKIEKRPEISICNIGCLLLFKSVLNSQKYLFISLLYVLMLFLPCVKIKN